MTDKENKVVGFGTPGVSEFHKKAAHKLRLLNDSTIRLLDDLLTEPASPSRILEKVEAIREKFSDNAELAVISEAVEALHKEHLQRMLKVYESRSNEVKTALAAKEKEKKSADRAAMITGIAGLISSPLIWIATASSANKSAELGDEITGFLANLEEFSAAPAALREQLLKEKQQFADTNDLGLASPLAALLIATEVNHRTIEFKKICMAHGKNADEVIYELPDADSQILQDFLRGSALGFGSTSALEQAVSESKANYADSSSHKIFLQYVNQHVLPRKDYYDIWQSKYQDFIHNFKGLRQAFESMDPTARPRFEILGEKPIAMSGKRDVSALPAIKNPATPTENKAMEESARRQHDARLLATQLIHDLYDPNLGSLKERHAAVTMHAARSLQDFNDFFKDIDNSLKKISTQLAEARHAQNGTEMRWERAEGIALQLKLLALRDPWEMAKERFIGDVVGAGLGAAAEMSTQNAPIHSLTNLASSTIKNSYTYARAKVEHEVQSISLHKRDRHIASDLESELLALDKKIEELLENKEFYAYLADANAVGNTKTLLMLLPRIMAGESNIDALDARLERHGFTDIDTFIEEAGKKSPRLRIALENQLFGLANSNDLKVLLTEANAIEAPHSPYEGMLVDYVENAIKRHYPDQARQASMMDTLMLRNVVPTRAEGHSFGEIVSLETDAALRALLGGTGNFVLIGSQDIHNIYAYHLSKHSDDSRLFDPYGSNLVAGKFVQYVANDQIEAKRDQAIRQRGATTRIPRASELFVDICVHEYLLGQGVNTIKDPSLKNAPGALAAFEMVNEVTADFVRKLALNSARKKMGKSGIGRNIEGLIASSFIDFFLILGAQQMGDPKLQESSRKVSTAYTGENYSLASELYKDKLVENAKDNFSLFLDVYQHNLTKYLSHATRENRAAMLNQLDSVKDVMKEVQLTERTVLPGSDAALFDAHYKNHAFSNVGLSYESWAQRAKAIVADENQRS